MVATSATIIPAPSSHQHHPMLSIPVQTQQKPTDSAAESMSLIVQLGTTNVGYTSPMSSSNAGGTNATMTNHTGGMTSSAQSRVNQQMPVAKHRMPMTINRQPQQHSLPVRNIAALARPIPHAQAQVMSSGAGGSSVSSNVSGANLFNASSQISFSSPPHQNQISHNSVLPVVAGRVLASPVKDSNLDDDLLEGVVEKRPKYHKHLPLNYQYVLQDHNYGAPPPPTPPSVSPSKSPINGVPPSNGVVASHPRDHPLVHSQSVTHAQSVPTTPPVNYTASAMFNSARQVANSSAVTNDVESDVSSDGEREVEPEGEETETAPEGEGDDEDSVTRCVCDFQHDDGYMICCDRCSVWQHVDCMGIDRNNIPDEYMCELCKPRRVDKQRAVTLQIRKRQELNDTTDSSSETSSGSDNHTVVNKPAPRKRAVVARRRSEPARKPSLSSAAKPRRESTRDTLSNSARTNNRQATRKRNVEKRPTARRKNNTLNNSVHNANSHSEKKTVGLATLSATTASSLSTSPLMTDKVNHHHEKSVTSPTGSDSVQQLRQWIDSYEEAVTNHYSPELRARIANIKVNGVHSDLRLPSNLLATPKCRISLLPNGTKILMACATAPVNQPLIELRGKYMLGAVGNSGLNSRSARAAAPPPPPGPHIFHYKLPRDNTEVCVDCRTYGNDARFVRRSCQPNAEIRHCIEKGTLHLYLVTTSPIDKNSEVTIAHVPNCGVPCLCGDKDCHAKREKEKELAKQREKTPPKGHVRRNGFVKEVKNVAPSNNSQSANEKRRRGRRRTESESQVPELTQRPAEKVSVKEKQTTLTTGSSSSSDKRPQSPTVAPPSPPSQPITRSASATRPSKVAATAKNATPAPVNSKKDDTAKSSNVVSNNNNNKTVNNNSSTSNHEDSNVLEEGVVQNRRSSTNSNSATNIGGKKDSTEGVTKKDAAEKKNNKMTREERKMEAIMKAFERLEKDQARKQEAARQAQQRKDSTDTEKEKQPTVSAVVESKETSSPKEKEQEEPLNTIKNNNAIKRRRRKGKSRPHPIPQPVSRARVRTRRTAVRRRSSNMSRSRSNSQANEDDESESARSSDNDADEESQSPVKPRQAADVLSTISTLNNYSNKEQNECLSTPMRRRRSSTLDNKDSEGPNNSEDDDEDETSARLNTSGQSTSSSDLPNTPLSNTCLLVAAAVGPLAPGFKFPKTKKGYITSWFKAPDPGSPPSVPTHNPEDSPTRPGPGKKRWLRQAITDSQECESPNRPETSASPTDYVAPLKKRRLARESISSEQSFTPPATPMGPVNQMSYDDEDDENFPTMPDKPAEYDGVSSGGESETEVAPAVGPRTPLGLEPKLEPEVDLKVEQEEDEVFDIKEENDSGDFTVEDIKNEILRTSMLPVVNSVGIISSEADVKCEIKVEKPQGHHQEPKRERKPITPAARKKVLSISEYRQRKMQGDRESQDGDDMDGSDITSGNMNMVTSSPRSHTSDTSSMSSSDEEDANHANLMSKALLLESGLLSKSDASRFNSAPTLVERQRENLTERLRREFGLFLSDDEELSAARRQSMNNEMPTLQTVQVSSTIVATPGIVTIPGAMLNSVGGDKKEHGGGAPMEKEKRRKPPPPPPPPPLPVPNTHSQPQQHQQQPGPPTAAYPMYHGYPPAGPIRAPSVYQHQPHYNMGVIPPPTLETVNLSSATPYYGPNAYYGSLPRSH